MEYTAEDIRLYHILLDASTDGRCHSIPIGLTQRDIDRFVELEWCGIAARKVIVLAYNELTFSDLEKAFNQTCKKQAKANADEELKKMQLAMDNKKQIKQNRRNQILTAVISSVVTLVIEHFFDIVVCASNFWNSLFP